MTDELKPCPFCGAEQIGYSLGKNFGRQVCMICCTQGPLVEGNPETEQFWDNMVSEWNNRKETT